MSDPIRLLYTTLLWCLISLCLAQDEFGPVERKRLTDGTIVEIRPGKILTGTPVEEDAHHAETVETCIEWCRNSTKAKCKGAVLYENTKVCMLFIHTGLEPGEPHFIYEANPGDKTHLIMLFTEEEWLRAQQDMADTEDTETIRGKGRWIRRKVVATTDTRNNCQPDASPNCKEWAAKGDCQTNPFWMKSNCQQSCNSCGTSNVDAGAKLPPEQPGCRNHNSNCNFWAFMNECSGNPAFMLTSCCHACRNINAIKQIG